MNPTTLPALKSLIASEAAARLGSVGKAAKELYVTHSAVSQNIKQLETFLGRPLFLRSGRRISIMEDAEAYLDEIREALDQIGQATRAFQLSARADNVTLKMVITLALRWFIPKITELRTIHPSLSLRLVTEPESDVTNLSQAIDAAIGFCRKDELADLYSVKLYPSELVLVVNDPTKNDIERTLASQTAIYVAAARRANDWRRWCQAMNVAPPKAANRLRLPNSAAALEAVSAGAGALVTQKIFVEQLIALRHLQQVGAPVADDSQGYYFYCAQNHMERPAIGALHDWLLDTAERDRDKPKVKRPSAEL